MRNLILATILAMTYNNLSANITASNDTCKGVIEITNFGVNEITLYKNPEGQVFDTLKFILHGKAFVDSTTMQKLIHIDAYYTIELKSGNTFTPYHLVDGESAKNRAESNKHYWESNDLWEKTHFSPIYPINELSFRLIGDYEDWLCIVLDEKTNKKAFIRRDEVVMRFTPWKAVIKGWDGIIFLKSNAYDNKDGKQIKFKKEEKGRNSESFYIL